MIIYGHTPTSFDWTGLVTAITALVGLLFAAMQAMHATNSDSRKEKNSNDAVIDILNYYQNQLNILYKSAIDAEANTKDDCRSISKIYAKIIKDILYSTRPIKHDEPSSKVLIEKIDAESFINNCAYLLNIYSTHSNPTKDEIIKMISDTVGYVKKCQSAAIDKNKQTPKSVFKIINPF
jgi:hypothetical protein